MSIHLSKLYVEFEKWKNTGKGFEEYRIHYYEKTDGTIDAGYLAWVLSGSAFEQFVIWYHQNRQDVGGFDFGEELKFSEELEFSENDSDFDIEDIDSVADQVENDDAKVEDDVQVEDDEEEPYVPPESPVMTKKRSLKPAQDSSPKSSEKSEKSGKRQKQACRKCGQSGHNQRTCTNDQKEIVIDFSEGASEADDVDRKGRLTLKSASDSFNFSDFADVQEVHAAHKTCEPQVQQPIVFPTLQPVVFPTLPPLFADLIAPLTPTDTWRDLLTNSAQMLLV